MSKDFLWVRAMHDNVEPAVAGRVGAGEGGGRGGGAKSNFRKDLVLQLFFWGLEINSLNHILEKYLTLSWGVASFPNVWPGLQQSEASPCSASRPEHVFWAIVRKDHRFPVMHFIFLILNFSVQILVPAQIPKLASS